jgi:hypothetical protein
VSEQKHTPGPWRVGDAVNTIFGPPLVRRRKGESPSLETIATLHGNRHGNANLIAAAPELLAALEMITYCRAAGCDCDARKAIQKARGE